MTSTIVCDHEGKWLIQMLVLHSISTGKFYNIYGEAIIKAMQQDIATDQL